MNLFLPFVQLLSVKSKIVTEFDDLEHFQLRESISVVTLSLSPSLFTDVQNNPLLLYLKSGLFLFFCVW